MPEMCTVTYVLSCVYCYVCTPCRSKKCTGDEDKLGHARDGATHHGPSQNLPQRHCLQVFVVNNDPCASYATCVMHATCVNCATCSAARMGSRGLASLVALYVCYNGMYAVKISGSFASLNCLVRRCMATKPERTL